MRRLDRLLAALMLLWAGSASAATDAPFLWELKTDTASHWLLGSIHMLRRDAYPLPEPLEAAYRLSDVVVFETDPAALMQDGFQQRLASAGLAPAGIAAMVPKPLLATLHQQLQSNGLPTTLCERLRPWMCAVAIETTLMMQDGYRPELGVDMYFYQRASHDARPVRALESANAQAAVFTEMSPALSSQMLEMTLRELAQTPEGPGRAVQQWLHGDVAGLREEVEASLAAYPQLHGRLLLARNRRWITTLVPWLGADQSLLIVVGAAHLVGDQGLPELLRERGYDLTRVDCSEIAAARHRLCDAASGHGVSAGAAAAGR